MTAVTISAPTVSKTFPAGTVDTDYGFAITGTLADGTPFSASTTAPTSSTTVDLAAGTYTAVVSKLGVASLPSDPLTVSSGGGTVTLSVPDAAGKATMVLA